MIDKSVSHNLTVVQLEHFQEKLRKQNHTHEELFTLSCKMFKVLYERNPNCPLVASWHETARKLIGG